MTMRTVERDPVRLGDRLDALSPRELEVLAMITGSRTVAAAQGRQS